MPCSGCRASSTWAPRTSSASSPTCSGCGRSARRSGRSRAAARRSRTRSTTRCGTGSRTSRRPITCWARRWAPIPTRRSSATSSGGSATRPPPRSSRSRAGCRTSRWPASAAARTRSGCWRGSSASRRSVSRSPRPRATGSRPADTRRRSPAARRGSSTAARSMMLQDRDGQVVEAVSASAGLDYPGVGPQIAALAAAGRLELSAATDDEAFAGMRWLARTEGILPALETAHALATLPRILAGTEGAGRDWAEEAVVLIGFSGRGDKDLVPFGRWIEAQAIVTRDRRGAAGRDERDGRRPADRGGVRGRGRGRASGADPVRRRRLPRCGHELRRRPRRGRRRRGRARARPAVLRPARRRGDAPEGEPGRAPQRRDARGQPAADRADRRGAAGDPRRADGLREPVHRRRRRPRIGSTALVRGRGRRDRRRPDARRGRPVRVASPGSTASRSSTSWRRRRRRFVARRSPRGAAASSTACRSSA